MWGLSYGLLDVLNKRFSGDVARHQRRNRGCCRRPISAPYFCGAARRGTLWTARRAIRRAFWSGCALYALGDAAVRAGGVGQQLRRVPCSRCSLSSGLGCTAETAANPYAAVRLGGTRRAERRLSLAQSFKQPPGRFIGPLIGGTLFFSASQPRRRRAIKRGERDDLCGDRRAGAADRAVVQPRPAAGDP
ncbi:hypothetical protein M8494_24700 [Serratia ureilytica]